MLGSSARYWFSLPALSKDPRVLYIPVACSLSILPSSGIHCRTAILSFDTHPIISVTIAPLSVIQHCSGVRVVGSAALRTVCMCLGSSSSISSSFCRLCIMRRSLFFLSISTMSPSVHSPWRLSLLMVSSSSACSVGPLSLCASFKMLSLSVSCGDSPPALILMSALFSHVTRLSAHNGVRAFPSPFLGSPMSIAVPGCAAVPAYRIVLWRSPSIALAVGGSLCNARCTIINFSLFTLSENRLSPIPQTSFGANISSVG